MKVLGHQSLLDSGIFSLSLYRMGLSNINQLIFQITNVFVALL